MVKRNQVAKDVRVVLNNTFIVSSISRKYLKEEPELYIADGRIYNDAKGDYVIVKSEHLPELLPDVGTGFSTDMVYLTEIDLNYPIR